MMKKFLSAILALSLMAAMAVPAFAAESNAVDETGSGSASQDVTANYQEGEDKTDDVETAYYVTVAWNVQSSLTYTDGDTTYTWNAQGMQYSAETADSVWSGDATVTITVTNQSNAAVTAKAAWATVSGIVAGCTFTNNDAEIGSAADGVTVTDGAKGTAKNATITAKVGTPTDGSIDESDAKIGTVTVTIAAKAD